MNTLKVISHEGQFVTESRDVAEMVDQQHKELLRTIRGYTGILTSAGLRSSDFFIPYTYQDAKKEIRPSFLLSRRGCDMVANKMIGQKGVLFTAAYVTRFEEMEKALNAPKLLSPSEQLKASMRLSLETSGDVEVLKGDVAELKEKVENQITLDHGEQRRLQRGIASRVYEVEKDVEIRKRLFSELHREIKDRFAVTSYKDVKRQDLQSAIRYVEAWIPKQK
ncbi:hypothetical protein FQ087_18815 [Sporosarcina sp. ANT_H38]|uniref:Rha family transcriptional regulator n=1 Tax=Sporosarcina sp. ANT_H38 TaxID=2597358 RepID=UPI0011F2A544|nr:Rha family transcriptional regulator [Sporosarcina sp. ANT_H38]KAA0944177.1 hypothetical protein FQ087_18815 [Sporosarcina sp. ANT_H38]